MASIELDRVSMSFQVRQQHQITLKEYFLRGMYLNSRNPKRTIHALRNVSLRYNEGARVAVVGGNGSGKSTLLRVLSGIYTPTSGRRRVHGNVCSLFELSLGFEMEANGWDNIRRRGYLQGEKPWTLEHKVEQIAEFSELGSFLDLPVRYYSAGMLVRLAFSIATAIEPEILLVDEVLGAGDLAFQAKAQERMQAMMQRARIIVVVSHDLDRLPLLCDEGVWLDRGQVACSGPIADVIAAYREHAEVCQPMAA